jgi:hypothetical protein
VRKRQRGFEEQYRRARKALWRRKRVLKRFGKVAVPKRPMLKNQGKSRFWDALTRRISRWRRPVRWPTRKALDRKVLELRLLTGLYGPESAQLRMWGRRGGLLRKRALMQNGGTTALRVREVEAELVRAGERPRGRNKRIAQILGLHPDHVRKLRKRMGLMSAFDPSHEA